MPELPGVLCDLSQQQLAVLQPDAAIFSVQQQAARAHAVGGCFAELVPAGAYRGEEEALQGAGEACTEALLAAVGHSAED